MTATVTVTTVEDSDLEDGFFRKTAGEEGSEEEEASGSGSDGEEDGKGFPGPLAPNRFAKTKKWSGADARGGEGADGGGGGGGGREAKKEKMQKRRSPKAGKGLMNSRVGSRKKGGGKKGDKAKGKKGGKGGKGGKGKR